MTSPGYKPASAEIVNSRYGISVGEIETPTIAGCNVATII